MKILAVADIESKFLYDYYYPGKLSGYDLIIACGDLSRSYLEFLVDASNATVLYVRGNHDDSFEDAPPEGCVCIDDKIYVHNGIRIMGLGGSHKYRNGKNMFTEKQMKKRVRKMRWKIFRHGGIDIFVTHAPARHINDFDSLSHRGFECFNDVIKRYKPKFFVHGHIHKNYGHNIPQRTTFGSTEIINAYDHCIFEIEDCKNRQIL